MGSRVVIKFGGADLSTGDRIRRAAEMVIKSPYEEVAVVVSAMGDTTGSLLKTLSQVGDVSDSDYAEVLSMGERTSARIFCSALRSLGAKAVCVDPTQDTWPIITDSNFRGAKPNLEKTKILVKKHLEPALGDSVPVVCGFLGRDDNGSITTLGRGGSDTTALLLANCLEADEVILVKETDGVLAADPKIVPGARLLDRLEIHEMFALALGGANIIKPEALKYKLSNQKLRVVSFSSDDLAVGGTEITGSFNPSSAEISKRSSLSAISVACEVNPENLRRLFSALHPKPVYGVSTGKKSITVFASSENADHETINRIHDMKCFKAISHRDKVGMIELNHPTFIDSPGWIAKISGALSLKNINIIEVVTSKATINVFVEEEKLDDALEAVSEIFEA